MQDDSKNTLIQTLQQDRQDENNNNDKILDGRVEERRFDRGSEQLWQQRQVRQRCDQTTTALHCCQEKEDSESVRIRDHSRDVDQRQEGTDIGPRRNGCQGEEKGDGKEWAGVRRQDKWRDQGICEPQEDQVGDLLWSESDMPFIPQDVVVGISQTPGNGDEIWWAPCINKRCLAKILGKCCLPKQLTQDLEDERKILKRMERIECSLSKISSRIDRLAQNGYVCKKHTTVSKTSSSNDSELQDVVSEEVDKENTETTSEDVVKEECPPGQNCVGRMVSFNSSLIKSVDSTFFDDSDECVDNFDSSDDICCSSSYCHGLMDEASCDKPSSCYLDHGSSCRKKSLSFCKDVMVSSKQSSSSENDSSSCNEKQSSFQVRGESSAWEKDCSSLRKEFLVGRKKSSTICKDNSSIKKEALCIKTPVANKASLLVCKETMAPKKKECSSNKSLSVTKKEGSSSKEGVASATESSSVGKDYMVCQKESTSFDKESLECEDLSDTTEESEQESSHMQESSENSQTSSPNCKSPLEKESETNQPIGEEKPPIEVRRLPYSDDDHQPYLIKKPDAIPRSVQRKLARLEAEQRC